MVDHKSDIVSKLRDGYRPAESEASAWTVAPTIQGLRDALTDQDLEWLLPLVAGEDGPHGAFYLALLQPFAQRDNVRHLLAQRFSSASPYLKSQLVWRLLDDPHLPNAIHAEIFAFVISDFDSFQDACVAYLGSPSEILSAALGRIADCPPSKRWIYFCCLPQYAADQHAVKGLLTVAAGLSEAFPARVAQALLQRFFTKER